MTMTANAQTRPPLPASIKDLEFDSDNQSILSGIDIDNGSVTSTASSKLIAIMNEAFDLDDEKVMTKRQRRPSLVRINDDDNESVLSHATITSMTIEAIKGTASFVMSHWKILCLGQFISLVMSIAGAAQATLHFDCDLSAPLFTSGIFFILLTLFLIPMYAREVLYRSKTMASTKQTVHRFLRIFPMKTQLWRYIVIAVMDVEACYCTVLAFRYTPMTSVTLFGALAVPSAMLLSKLVLGRSFGSIHFLGVFMCMAGVAYNILADYNIDSLAQGSQDLQEEYPNRLVGDFLAIMGGVTYGIVDVVSESTLKDNGGDITEFLGIVGFFATLLSLCQGWLTERDNILELYTGGKCTGYETASLLLIYIVASTFEYIGIAIFLCKSDATLLNLSVLTDPALWSVLFTVLAQHVIPPPLFWAALVFVASGLVMYELAPSPMDNTATTGSALLLEDVFDNDTGSEAYYSPEMNIV